MTNLEVGGRESAKTTVTDSCSEVTPEGDSPNPITPVILQKIEIKKESGKPRLTTRKPSEILSMEFDGADLYLENGVFSKGNPLTILGPAGVGKTRLLLQFAICTIVGRDFIGWPVGQRRLKWLILQSENSNRRLQADLMRFKDWVGDQSWKDVDANLVLHTLEAGHDGYLGLGDHTSTGMVAQLIRESQADVVVFDPLYAFAAGNLNTDAAMLKTCRLISELVKRGNPDASPLILHHTLTGKTGIAKSAGYDRASYGRGSKALQLWTRGQLNVAPGSAEDETKLVILCGKNSDGPAFAPVGLSLNTQTMIYEVDPNFDYDIWLSEVTGKPVPRNRPTPESIAEIVADVPLQRRELATAVMNEFGCGKSTAYNQIAAAEGRTITNTPQGRLLKL